ncbi:MAG: ParB/RepB/Spo0J family partition protein [Deltaproteobacteria bacterium]|nr:ParB/RepB/Spo0J family partition protein [Deltaproteobacteria bacterium]
MPEKEKAKKRALGRGIDTLIPNLDTLTRERDFFLCNIDSIYPNPMLPRQSFPDDSLNELAASIKEMGVIQPLIVRTASTGYELIAGERRWRAAKLAKLNQVPVLIKEASSSEMLELALIENIQRKDLNPLEEAEAYRRLVNEFGLTQEALGKRIGKDRSTVANFLRLLNLPEPIRADILNEILTMEHARVLAGIENPSLQKKAWRYIISKRLSVRGAEELVKTLKASRKKATKKKSPTQDDIYFKALEDDLTRSLGIKTWSA